MNDDLGDIVLGAELCPPETRVEIRTPGTYECDLVWKTSVFTDVIKLLLFSRSVMSDSLGPHRLYLVHQAPLSLGISRQEYWSGLPFPSPGDLPGSGIKPRSPALAGSFFTVWTTREAIIKLRWGYTGPRWTLTQYDWCPVRRGKFGQR